MIRVGLDARFLHFPGVGRYIRNLIAGLATANASEFQFVVYHTADGSSALGGLAGGALTLREVSFGPFAPHQHLCWPAIWRRDDISLFHAPHYVVPLLQTVPLVSTLHDLLYLDFPPRSLLRRAFYRGMNRACACTSSRLLTVSQFSKTRIMRAYGVAASKIDVVPNAIAPSFLTHERVSSARVPSDPYALYVGTNKPWKNLAFLLKVFIAFKLRSPNAILVLAGAQGVNEEPIPELLRRFGNPPNVIHLGAVSEADLVALYRAARVVLVPSSVEGFGFAALEAMASGAPVIAALAASLPEVVSDCGVLVDPADLSGWVSALQHLWEDEAARLRYAELGTARAREFTVARMAEQTLTTYRATLEK